MHLRGAHRTSHYCDYLSELEEVDLHTPKPPKWHIKHELNAHLSTSTLADSSPLVSSKRWFFSRLSTATMYLVSKVLSVESLYGVLVSMPSNLNYSEGFVLHLTLPNVYRFNDSAKI
jgi:hypothetical protein